MLPVGHLEGFQFAPQDIPLSISLPDHFSKELKLTPVEDPDENLRALAKHHAELSGSYVNWLATYKHAEQIWRKGFEHRNKVKHG